MDRWKNFPTTEHPPVPGAADAQAPLGPHPSYDDVLDVAVQYTFPCSDPIAVAESCTPAGRALHPEREEGQPKGPGMTPGHGEPVTGKEG
ncbi:hypothetical protein [Ramlibacter alkalitolerans]|jgi:hypothetical protein|uniref:Uncharacterized protein n=1 Tax=Ramlibacter alkalitolerans TaxID=2039631 RepID=A0ABS1JRI9_9BURK|nr:hypothetical protein [Ramlibacter alkalitolerans]MBL0426889.1 hypothetical protein [Ramlibacter alkalitolerans]